MGTAAAAAVVFDEQTEATLRSIDQHADDHAQIDQIEVRLRDMPQVELNLRHYFASGTYAREITIPADTIIIGKIHKTTHLNIVSAGMIEVWSPGEEPRLIRAPFSFVAEPGVRRFGYAYADTVWTTIHGTDETDLVKLEQELIESRPSLLTLDASPLTLVPAIEGQAES